MARQRAPRGSHCHRTPRRAAARLAPGALATQWAPRPNPRSPDRHPPRTWPTHGKPDGKGGTRERGRGRGARATKRMTFIRGAKEIKDRRGRTNPAPPEQPTACGESFPQSAARPSGRSCTAGGCWSASPTASLRPPGALDHGLGRSRPELHRRPGTGARHRWPVYDRLGHSTKAPGPTGAGAAPPAGHWTASPTASLRPPGALDRGSWACRGRRCTAGGALERVADGQSTYTRPGHSTAASSRVIAH